MNKAEFKRRLEEVDSLIARGKYAEAVSKCDLLNLDLIDQPRRLQNIAKAYEKCRRYADAEDLLLLAHERAPKSRSIVYHLCSVATKADEVEEAKKYFQEFCELAKNDTQQYVLQYRIARAEKQPDSVLIDILENYKMAEPDDRWMLELAKLYAKSGDTEKAVGVCEDIDLWFNSGKFVSDARTLKAELLGTSPEEPEEELKEERFFENAEASEEEEAVVFEETITPEETAMPEEELSDEELMILPPETMDEIVAGVEDVEARREAGVKNTSNYYGAPKAEAEEVTAETLKALAKTVSFYSVPSHNTPVTDVTYTEEDEAPVSEEAYVEVTPEKEEKKPFAVPEFVAPDFGEEDIKDIEDMAFTMDAGTPIEHGKAKEESAPVEEEKIDTSVYDGLQQVEIDLAEDDDMLEVIWQDPDVFVIEQELKRRAEESADPATWGRISFTEEEPEVPEMPEEAPEQEEVVFDEHIFEETEAKDEHIVVNVTEAMKEEAPEEAADIAPENFEERPEDEDEEGEFSDDEDFNAFLQELERRDSERPLFGNLPIEPEVTEETWHFVVFGQTNMLTTECARERMKEISEENPSCPTKMLKISSEKIGNASIINSLDHFLGNMVIVEQAASLSDSQLEEFAKVLDKDDRSLLIAFTDSKDDVIDMFSRVPKLADSFTAVFEGKKFNARDLVNTAKEYLLTQEARMTKAAEGLVYEKARKLLSEKNGFYKNDIREYAELALQKADRGGFLGLAGGKVDDEGLLVVDEKHFRKVDRT